MTDTIERYRDDFDHEGQSVAWQAPDGRRFLISRTSHGYALRSPDDWESDDEVEFEANFEGQVYFRGEPVSWKVPAAALSRTS